MKQYTLSIEGMVCSMCEAHINDVVRKAVPEARKVASSHKKGECVFQAEEIDEDLLKEEIRKTGYTLSSIRKDEAETKGWSLFRGRR